MSKTKYLGISVYTKTDDLPTIDWMQSVNGNGEDSLAMQVDKELEKISRKEVYSSEQPQDQRDGDVWNEILSITDGGGN
ncbi:hypothetical protein D5272_01330 [bacterium D16-76]|nr:hypothetical protein [bacterium D16-76]